MPKKKKVRTTYKRAYNYGEFRNLTMEQARKMDEQQRIDRGQPQRPSQRAKYWQYSPKNRAHKFPPLDCG